MTKLMGKFNEKCTQLYVSAKQRTANEEGATTVEWVGLAFVILTLMFVIQGAMEGKGDGIATAITSKIAEIIGDVGN